MPMTIPPCKPDGADCPRRRVGCRAQCAEYREWAENLRAEKIAMRQAKNRTREATDRLVDSCIAYRKKHGGRK